jgi:hypothetical protein
VAVGVDEHAGGARFHDCGHFCGDASVFWSPSLGWFSMESGPIVALHLNSWNDIWIDISIDISRGRSVLLIGNIIFQLLRSLESFRSGIILGASILLLNDSQPIIGYEYYYLLILISYLSSIIIRKRRDLNVN